MSAYRYAAFGLQIDADVVLPELPPGGNKQADVRIICGEVPDRISQPLEKTSCYQAAVNEFLLKIKGVADYYITNGKQIVLQLHPAAGWHTSKLYLLGTAMGVLLLQRGVMPIHGSAVVMNGRGVIFTGISGAGKSTMAAALHKQGFSLMADDVSAIMVDHGGIPWIQPGYPQQKLWQASASLIGIDTTLLERVCAEREKYLVPLAKGFRKKAAVAGTIYEIVVKPCADSAIVPLKGIEKITAIMRNIYRAELVNGLGLQAAQFQQCANLLNYVEVFRLIRPANTISVERQAAMVVGHGKELQLARRDTDSRLQAAVN